MTENIRLEQLKRGYMIKVSMSCEKELIMNGTKFVPKIDR